MVSSYCIVFRGVHNCKTVTALNINHGLYFSNPGSYKPGIVHCSKTQTKPHQNRGSDQVYTDQVSAWFNGGLNHGLDHCSKIGPQGLATYYKMPSDIWRYPSEWAVTSILYSGLCSVCTKGVCHTQLGQPHILNTGQNLKHIYKIGYEQFRFPTTFLFPISRSHNREWATLYYQTFEKR